MVVFFFDGSPKLPKGGISPLTWIAPSTVLKNFYEKGLDHLKLWVALKLELSKIFIGCLPIAQPLLNSKLGLGP